MNRDQILRTLRLLSDFVKYAKIGPSKIVVTLYKPNVD